MKSSHVWRRGPSDFGVITQQGYRKVATTKTQREHLCDIMEGWLAKHVPGPISVSVVAGTKNGNGLFVRNAAGQLVRAAPGELDEALWGAWKHAAEYALNDPEYRRYR